MLHSLELDLSRLWKLDVPEEEFVNLYSKVHATPISCFFFFFLLVFSFSVFFVEMLTCFICVDMLSYARESSQHTQQGDKEVYIHDHWAAGEKI